MAIAKLKYLRMSEQKVRLVADQIRRMRVVEAMNVLEFSPKKAAFFLKKLLNSVIANYKDKNNSDDLIVKNLFIYKICVDKATMFKRFRARAKGRANHILKRNCHVLIEIKPIGE